MQHIDGIVTKFRIQHFGFCVMHRTAHTKCVTDQHFYVAVLHAKQSEHKDLYFIDVTFRLARLT